MSFSHAYAAVIREAEENNLGKPFAEKLLKYMKAKGHLSLLSQVLRLTARASKKGITTVTVAKKNDTDKYKAGISAALKSLSADTHHVVIEDERMVGGYTVRAKGKLIDNSFRSALVSLYRSIARF
ncbi:F0F1 ATP synthase subunit delta [Patescibacteria group bacterium]|nr:F0F1 ATP synthase subunit delta [Patescibacteria group bacterium]